MTAKPNLRPDGYIRIFEPEHPLANSDGYVLEHRKVLYDAGAQLFSDTHVHHHNGDRRDNRLENLEALDAGDHHRHHNRVAGFVTNQSGVWPLVRERECETCGKSFRPLIQSSRFCSRGCANTRRPRIATCLHCDAEYEAVGATAKYCSAHCRMAAFRKRLGQGQAVCRP